MFVCEEMSKRNRPRIWTLEYRKLDEQGLLWKCIGILLVGGVLVYFQVLFFDFLRWDDPANVSNNPYIKSPSLSGVIHFWQNAYWNLYIPLIYTLYSISAGISHVFFPEASHPSGLNPGVFHGLNLFLHLLNSILVLRLFRDLLSYERGSTYSDNWHYLAPLFGTLVFLLHPIQVETVAWISATKDLTYTFFGLLAIQNYLFFLNKRKVDEGERKERKRGSEFGTYVISLLCFSLALLSKPSAVCIPLFVLVLSYFGLKRPLKETATFLFPWLIICLPLIIYTKIQQPSSDIEYIADVWLRPLIALDSISFYLYKILFPLKLSAVYERSPQFIVESGQVYWTGLPALVLFLIGLVFWKRREFRIACVGILLLYVGLLPVSGLIPFRYQDYSTVADHYLYFPLIGFCLLVAWITMAFSQLKAVRLVVVLFCCLIAIRTSFSLRNWKDDEVFADFLLRYNRNSYVGLNVLGYQQMSKHEYEEAYKSLKKSLSIKPQSDSARKDFGALLFRMNRYDEAIEYFKQLSLEQPKNAEWRKNLGVLYYRKKMVNEAISSYLDAISINPNYGEVYQNLGFIYFNAKKPMKALNMYMKALSLGHVNPNVLNMIGVIYLRNKREREAIPYFERALRMDPSLQGVRSNLKLAVHMLGKKN